MGSTKERREARQVADRIVQLSYQKEVLPLFFTPSPAVTFYVSHSLILSSREQKPLLVQRNNVMVVVAPTETVGCATFIP